MQICKFNYAKFHYVSFNLQILLYEFQYTDTIIYKFYYKIFIVQISFSKFYCTNSIINILLYKSIIQIYCQNLFCKCYYTNFII